MRVLFVTKYFHPHVGGVEKHVYSLSRELTKMGHGVTILTSRYNHSLPSNETIQRIEVFRFKILNLKYFGLLVVWLQMVKRINLFLKAEVIHVHDVFIWFWPLRIIMFWKKVYVTFHGWEGKYPIPRKNKLIRKISNAIATKSIDVGEYLQKYYETNPNKVLYGALYPARKIYNKIPKKIVFVGRLSADTGVRLLLNALGEMADYNVQFCGDGPLRRECSRFGRVLGFVDPRKHIQDAEYCFCGGYLAIMEAMSSECVVIAGYENKIRKDILTSAPFRKYINVVNSKDAIVRVLNSHKKSKNMIKEAKNWVDKQTWKKLADEYLALWEAG